MRKLLVVDDDIGNRAFVVDVLMEEWPNCETLAAPNGRIGLEIALKELPDVILLDWEMPEMDGISMLKALRSHEQTLEIPVVMYTGVRRGSLHLKQALEAGANEFLRKPVDAVELLARIRSILFQVRYYREKVELEQEKQRIRSEGQQRELQLKKNDLASLMLIMEKKDAFLNSTLQALEALGKTESPLDREMNKIIVSLRHELKSEKNWEAMKVRMNGIHADFLSRLVNKHPDLTPNELKLCSLMKLNLSQKETAEILHISVSGVEKGRYRLRKKLGLDSSIKMENYIHSLTQSSLSRKF